MERKSVLFRGRIAVLLSIVLLALNPLSACTNSNGTGDSQTSYSQVNAASKTTVRATAAATKSVSSAQQGGPFSGAGTTTKSSTTSESAVAGSEDSAELANENGNDSSSLPANMEDLGNVENADNEYDYKGDGKYAGGLTEVSYDLKGRIVKFAVASPLYTYEYFKTFNDEFITLTKRIDFVQTKYNCKIELVQHASQGAVQTALATNAVAGTYWADTTQFVGSWLLKYKNVIQPLDDYIDFNAPNTKLNANQAALLYNGRQYVVIMQNKINYDVYMLYNRDIVSREGLPDILSLQREGQWTWNTLLDIAIKATRDLDGDGITDQWGLVSDSRHSLDGVVKAMIASNGGYLIDNSNGDYRLALTAMVTLKALYFLNDLQNIHKTGQIYGTTKDYQLGKAAIAFGNMPGTRPYKSEYPQNSCFVVYPKGPDIDRYVVNNISAGGFAGAMPYNVDNPDIIAKIVYDLNSIYDDTYPDYLQAPDVVAAFNTYIFSDDDYETLNLAKHIVQDIGTHFDTYAFLTSDLNSTILTGSNSLVYTIMEKNVPVQTAIDSIRDVVSDKITTLINQYTR